MFFPSAPGTNIFSGRSSMLMFTKTLLSYAYSTHHLSLATLPVTSPDDPNLPDIRSEYN